MKILHTSDWHLGKKLLNKDRIEEQKNVMAEITKIANDENVDLILVAGDLFDNYSPSNIAQRLLYETLQNLTDFGRRPVIAIAGNHDSPERIESPEALADVSGIFLLGHPDSQIECFTTHQGLEITASEAGFMEIRLPKIPYPVRILYTPYANEERLRTYLNHDRAEQELRLLLASSWQAICQKHCNPQGVNIMAAHLFVIQDAEDQKTQEPEDENSINVGGASAIYAQNIPPEIQYTALGHLHRCQQIGSREIWYSGSPLEYSFAESQQDKYVLISEIEPHQKATTKKVKLLSGQALQSVHFTNIEETLLWLQTHRNYWIDLTLETEQFLTSVELKSIYDCHDGIITLRPFVKKQETNSNDTASIQEWIHDKDALFSHFFESQKGQLPNSEILNLFHEIIAKP